MSSRRRNRGECEILRPYYLQSSCARPRAGQILEMTCLFSGSVWSGRLAPSYAGTADVFRALIDLAIKLHGKRLSAAATKELNGINTHVYRLTLSDDTLQELAALNDAAYIRLAAAIRKGAAHEPGQYPPKL